MTNESTYGGRCFFSGADPQKAINNLAKKMNTSKYNAGRLVMTEEAYFSSLSQKEAFQELGVEQYEIVATLDSHTSEICRNLDRKHFPMTDYQPGATAPPFHVYCRSTTAPYFDDDFGIVGQRAARDEGTGKTYYVPADMTYKEWEGTFVKNGNKSGLNSSSNSYTLQYKNSKSYKKENKDTVNYSDITREWINFNSDGKGTVIEKETYTVNDVTYVVDGKHVILKPSIQEKKIAEILSEKYFKTVELVPQILYPQGIQTPDYLINGERFDLKSPTGEGKNLIYGLIAKKRKQANNFIIDISNCNLNIDVICKQIENLYLSPRLGFLKKIVLMKNGEILKVFGRK